MHLLAGLTLFGLARRTLLLIAPLRHRAVVGARFDSSFALDESGSMRNNVQILSCVSTDLSTRCG